MSVEKSNFLQKSQKNLIPFEIKSFLTTLINEFYQFTHSDFIFLATKLPSGWDLSSPFFNNLTWDDKHILKKINSYIEMVTSNKEIEKNSFGFVKDTFIPPYKIFVKPLVYKENLLGILFFKAISFNFSAEQQHIFDFLITNFVFAIYNMILNKTMTIIEKDNKEFIAEFSHEIKVPLNVVIGFSDLLFQQRDMDEERKKLYLQNILGSAHHMLNLIQGILDVSLVEADFSELRREKINSKQIIARVVSSLELLAAKKKIKLILFTIEADIFVELKSFNQLLYNIIQNAIKYAYEDSDVNIFSYIENNKFIFEVENKGPKINLEDSEKIFRFFERGDSEEIKKQEGNGVGLALCKRIAQAHGGEIKFCCTKDGVTSFWFELSYEEEE